MRFQEAVREDATRQGFVPRERRNQIINDIIAFFIATVLLGVLIVLSRGTIAPQHALVGSIVVVVALCIYVVTRKQQNLDLVMTTEYQNLLFSQASVLGFSFVMFVRRDGTIVYASEGVKTLFPTASGGESKALDEVFEQGGVASSDRERILKAIYEYSKERIIFPLGVGGGAPKDYILTVDPIRRPDGYLVVRVREYYQQRAGLQRMPDALQATSAEKIDHLLNTSIAGHYVTDAYHRLEYVNPALEEMLGFGPGELVEAKANLNALLYQVNNLPVPEDFSLTEFFGAAAMKQKQGSITYVTLQQVPRRERTGKVLGYSGTVTLREGVAR